MEEEHSKRHSMEEKKKCIAGKGRTVTGARPLSLPTISCMTFFISYRYGFA